jgi:enediyne biosynthesis protein E4
MSLVRLSGLALVLAAIIQPAMAETGPVIPQFVEETQSSGIASTFTGDYDYMVGGGVASFDCNSDGFPDLLLAGGEVKSSFYRNASKRGQALAFVQQESGLELDKVLGTYPLDIDSDGKTDLVLLRQGENVLMRGKGDCMFERVNEAWGFDGGAAWSAAFAATWEAGSVWPSLAIGNYINRDEELSPWGSCTDNWLHRPHPAAAKFAPPVALTPSYCALSMLFTDWNRSGTASLRITNDREYYEGGQEQMWHLEPGKAARLYTEAEGWERLRIWGMGIASYDIDHDSYPEYFLTSMGDNKLQVLAKPDGKETQPKYKDIAYLKGVTAHRPFAGLDLRTSTAWHTQFEDVNNDGLIDLFVAKGNVAKMPDFAMEDPNNLLVQAANGKFLESADKAGVASTKVSRGAAIVDFNLDGLLDLVVVNRWDKAQIWRNTTKDAGHWIEVQLQQESVNRNAIGAWIEIRVGAKILRREITSGGGHASGQNGWWHFGLGPHQSVELRVAWPGGKTGSWTAVDADAFYTVSPSGVTKALR